MRLNIIAEEIEKAEDEDKESDICRLLAIYNDLHNVNQGLLEILLDPFHDKYVPCEGVWLFEKKLFRKESEERTEYNKI